MDSDTDVRGTDERASADGEAPRDGADISLDRTFEDFGADDDASQSRESVKIGGYLSSDEDNAERAR